MDGMLSQNEINALLNDMGNGGIEEQRLSDVEKDAIGEIANISMGTAATTLFSLVNRKVDISTPVVSFATWDEIVDMYEKPCVFIRIAYTVGLDGSNILVLRENDVKIITDLMMGGEGVASEEPLSELHLSAISEAMNQMMGSAATSLSSMLEKTIDISPPKADLIDLSEAVDGDAIDEFLSSEFVKISFRMEIGDLIDSEIMQLYPFSFAREMYECFAKNMNLSVGGEEAQSQASSQQAAPQQAAPQQAAPQPQAAPQMQAAPQGMGMQMDPNMMGMQMQGMGMPMQGMPMQGMPMQGMGMPMMGMPMMGMPGMDVNVQPAQFQPFMGEYAGANQPENIELIKDVPLEVTVELGRTSKSIQEILDFNPGTIIELEKIAGEPIDVLVNGKYVARGEVVVIEENFGVRIVEIIKD